MKDYNSDGEYNRSGNGRGGMGRFVRYHTVTVTSIINYISTTAVKIQELRTTFLSLCICVVLNLQNDEF
jgi:hypothetical protein